MRKSTRAAAVMQARKHEKKLTTAPRSVSVPTSGGNPAFCASTCNGAGALVQSLRFASKRQHFRVGAQKEEQAGQNRAPLYGSRDAGQRIPGFRTERCRAFKSHRAEDREHQAQAKLFRSDALQRELPHVGAPSVLDDNADRDDGNQGHRYQPPAKA